MRVRTGVRSLALTLASATLLVVPAQLAAADTWHRHYYDNYFRSFFTCISRGEGAIGHRTRDQRIYGAKSYVCYKSPGDYRYSMDILFASGGGGGGGSWRAVR